MVNPFASNIGILAIEHYFPSWYVDQNELEQAENVPTGKFTIGLGQEKMSFISAREDVVSMALTAVHRLFKRLNLSYESIGRLDVGSESNIDKSKSIKTHIMQLFGENCDIEGVDNVNACYGGTAAIFNVINWMESSYWDGRLGLVVMSDNAIYNKNDEQSSIQTINDIISKDSNIPSTTNVSSGGLGAMATGGAGAIALLIGPNADLVFEQGVRASCMQHEYDFYKPMSVSDFPMFDGRETIACYLRSMVRCWMILKGRLLAKSSSFSSYFNLIDLEYNNSLSKNGSGKSNSDLLVLREYDNFWIDFLIKKISDITDADYSLQNMFKYACFHSPFSRLVQKAHAYLLSCDDLLRSLQIPIMKHYQGTLDSTEINDEQDIDIERHEIFNHFRTLSNNNAKDPITNEKNYTGGVNVMAENIAKSIIRMITKCNRSKRSLTFGTSILLDQECAKLYSGLIKDMAVVKIFENVILTRHSNIFDKMTKSSTDFIKITGNSYTGSVYVCLASLLAHEEYENLINSRILIYSYGSGLASSMYSVQVKNNNPHTHNFSIKSIKKYLIDKLDYLNNSRIKCNPEFYHEQIYKRQQMYQDFNSIYTVDITDINLQPDTFYLHHINRSLQRKYCLFVSSDDEVISNSSF